MNEEWRSVVGYEGFYEVSNFGRVRCIAILTKWGSVTKVNRIMKQRDTHDGYKRVSLSLNKKLKHKTVHRLVALAFIPNPQNIPEVNHKDENTKNNCVENLEWCSRKYNANYGTLPQRESEWGINHPKKSIPVVKMALDGEFLAEYPSIKEAARQHGIGDECIVRCCKGKQETSAGYKWKYKKDYETD